MSAARLYLGRIHRGPADAAPAEALAVAEGRVIAVGSAAEVRAALPDAPDTIELGGDVIVPGFLDAHHHFVLSALIAGWPSAREARSVSDVQDALRTAAAARDEGWIFVTGVDPQQLAEDVYPSLEALDAVSTERPVLALGRSLHEAAVNRRGLERLGGEAAWADQPKAVLKTRAGALTGEIREQPVARALAELVRETLDRDRAGAVRSLQAWAERLADLGLCRVLDPGLGPVEEALLHEARAAGLAIDVDYMLASRDGLFMAPEDRLADLGSSRHLKVFVDGGAMVAMSWSAWEIVRYSLGLPFRAARLGSTRLIKRALREDVLPGPGGRYHGGVTHFSREALNELCRRAMDRGFSIALHASGTEAIDRGLEALAQRGSDRPELPDQLIHFLFPAPEHIARAAEVGAAVVLQPSMVNGYAHDVHHSMPAGQFEYAPPLSKMRAAGVLMVLSSDAPIADPDPLAILEAAVKPARGEGIERAEALAQLTAVAARVVGRPEEGALRPGAPARLVRLDGDPLAPPESGRIRVRETWKDGARIGGEG